MLELGQPNHTYDLHKIKGVVWGLVEQKLAKGY